MNNFFRNLRFLAFYRVLTKRIFSLERFGDQCGWNIDPNLLNPDSIVLCAGAGHDISFEKQLISKVRCKVMLLDPSPTGIKTVVQEKLPSEMLEFRTIALSETDGTLRFRAPEDADEGSFYETNDNASAANEWPSRSLSSLAIEQRWPRIDLLKIDIEGSEYGVLNEIISKKVEAGQICVEFHYGGNFSGTRMMMINTILKLRRAGYDLVHHIHKDHTFINRTLLKT